MENFVSKEGILMGAADAEGRGLSTVYQVLGLGLPRSSQEV